MNSIDYISLSSRLNSLIVLSRPVTAFSNASSFLFHELNDVSWLGFYFYDPVIDKLILGPFQGKPACVRIETGKGVCGTAVAEDMTQLVPDVHAFPGHIACDSASNSEIVVPVHVRGEVYGVLDIDSPLKNRFTEDDREGLEMMVSILETRLDTLAC